MNEQILGDYRLIKQIGAGALGTLFLAEHRFIKKQFAIKILPKDLSQDRGFIERFQDEVAKLALLDHPHIVKIHNVSCADGLYFLVTDCIVDSLGETTNLAQYMAGRKERLREDELMSVVKQLADALDYAHLKGALAHRALKLNNVLIGRGDGGIDVFISDFGLSKIISAPQVVMKSFYAVAAALAALPREACTDLRYLPWPLDAEKQTKLTLSFLQSYAFLAPEQKLYEEVGFSADIFAFGVIVYYLISGKFPEGIFAMPSAIAPEYQFDWDQLLVRCLNQDPQKRPTELLPLLDQKKSGEVHHLLGMVEQFKEVAAQRAPFPHQVEREAGTLKPIIQRVMEEAPVVHPVPVEVPTVATLSPAKMAPSAEPEENYSQQLNAMLNRDPVITHYNPEKKETKKIEPLQTEMVVVQGGQFLRGSNSGHRDEMPAHKISVENFALDIHPITNEQFVRFLEYMGGEKDQNFDLIRLKDSRITRSGGRLGVEPGYAKHPVVGVTWYGADAYAKWAGKRLPYESEWEIACYGGLNHATYPTGEQIEKSQANFFSSDTTPVVSYPSNGYGLYDMVGNVYEWCQDWYGYNYYETSANEPRNPKGPLQGVYRVLRGGCWKSLQDDLRCSHRHRNNPGTVNSTYGFRCAADVQ